MISLSTILSALNQTGTAGSALILGITGSVAWLIQRYVGFQVWYWLRELDRIDPVRAIRAEIFETITSYKATFTESRRQETIAIIDEIHAIGKDRPLIIARSSENFIFESMRQNIHIFPSSTIQNVIGFYSSDKLFEATYDLQGTDTFRDASISNQKQIVNASYEDAIHCVEVGELAIQSLDNFLEHVRNRVNNTITTHLLSVVLIVVLAVKTLSW